MGQNLSGETQHYYESQNKQAYEIQRVVLCFFCLLRFVFFTYEPVQNWNIAFSEENP